MFYYYWGKENHSLIPGSLLNRGLLPKNGNCKISPSACHATAVKLFFPSQLKKVRHLLLLSEMMTMTYFCIVSASNLSYSQESMTLTCDPTMFTMNYTL